MGLGMLAAEVFALNELGKGVIEPVKEALWDETVKGAMRLFKYELAKRFGLLDLFAGTFDEICDTEPHLLTGFHTTGLIDVFDTLLRSTVIISILIGEEMSEELLLELLQEGVSNAIQTSIGGAYQTIFNVYRGGQPVYGDDIANLMRMQQYIDDKINVFNIASAGCNLPSTLFYLMHGHLMNLNDNYAPINQQLISLLTRAIEEELWLHLTYIELARVNLLGNLRRGVEITEKYIEITIDGIETALRRTNDMIQDLETELARLDADLTTEEDADLVREHIKQEFDKLKEVTDEFYNNMKQSIQQLEIKLTEDDLNLYKQALQKYRDAISKLCDIANRQYYVDLENGMQIIYNYIDMLMAYRYYSDTASYTEEEANQIKFISLEKTQVSPPPEEYTVKIIVYEG